MRMESRMMYLFRIENNLLDASVSYTFSKKDAIKIIKRNYFTGKDGKSIGRLDAKTYAQIVGSRKAYPVPSEIVELGVVRRYKV